MTAREFFLNNNAFGTLNPDLQELLLKSLDAIDMNPPGMAADLMKVFMISQKDMSPKKAFIMGILVGFAGADDRTQFTRRGF